MSIYCPTDGESDCDWYWEYGSGDGKPLDRKRSRRCCSCKARIAIGELAEVVRRYRGPGNDIEERIYGDEVPLSDWFLCETCNDLALSLDELGFCFELGGDSLKQQIAEYRQEQGAT